MTINREEKKHIEGVQKSYNQISSKYQEAKGESLVNVWSFRHWLDHQKGKILELGCGSGYPVAQYLLANQREYYGIDLSSSQVKLAQSEFGLYFEECEMLEYLNRLTSESFDSIISFFAIFHLPRSLHLTLLTQIHRVLKLGGYLLFNTPQNADIYQSDDFFGSAMKWENFSKEWYTMTLQELGFQIVSTELASTVFDGEIEQSWFLLSQKAG